MGSHKKMIDKELYEKIGKRIIAARGNETQSQLQEAVYPGSTENKPGFRGSVAMWETGERPMQAAELKAIAEHYGVSADWLLTTLPEGVRAIAGTKRVAYEWTGLSEVAMQKLHDLKSAHQKKSLDLVSKLLESPYLENLLLVMEQAEKAANSKSPNEWTEKEREAFNVARNALRECPQSILLAGEKAADSFIGDAAYIARRMIEDIVRSAEAGKGEK